jgi:hypothetical protein
MTALFKANGTVSKSDLTRAFQGKEDRQIMSAVASLINAEVITDPVVTPPGPKGGRPKMQWTYIG